ncbi:TRAP transporter substrate-binding protein [Oceanobacillus sp. CF4.6]|uniref:TRAP transporter substrate-binding protein n=1 Tax=Oceanobacillus sp. CF4.6 TaxID=3373080 RepID=UPI003EE59821
MKKLLSLAICMLVLFIAGCGDKEASSGNSERSENSEGKYVIRIPLLGSDTNFVNKSYAFFKENIEEKSDDRFEVQIYGSGTLASSEEQQLELVDKGNAELTSIASGLITNHADVNTFGIFDVPFMFTDNDKLYKFLDSELAKGLEEDLESKLNVKFVGNYDMKGYNMFNNVRPIESPKDMEGLKIRTSPIDLQINLLKELGANPTPLAYSETFTSLQQGTIDGVHMATAPTWTDKLYEASKYLSITKHVALVHFVMINNDFIDSLPDDLRSILDEELEVLIEELRKQGAATDEEAVQAIKDYGVEVNELSEEQFEEFRKSSENTIQEAVDNVGEDFYKEVNDLINN